MHFSFATMSGPIGRSPSCDCPLATLATGSTLGPPETKVGSMPYFLKLPSSTPAKKPPYWMLLIQDSWNDNGFACCANAVVRPIQEDDANVVAADAPAFNMLRRVKLTLNVIPALHSEWRAGTIARSFARPLARLAASQANWFASGVPHHSTGDENRANPSGPCSNANCAALSRM